MEAKLNTKQLEYSCITFSNRSGELLKIEPTGKILFSENVKRINTDKIAEEFIRIIENNTATKISEILKIVESDEYKNTEYKKFASEETRDFVKARLFDKICEILI